MKRQAEKYKFSVVVPIYNAELYLDETITSVLNQDIGFLENIQIILVNDGSTDGSEEICIKYQKEYPENIVYVKQENAGVSAARNHGMEYVEGKYVNFLDSDDKWSANAFSEVYAFFEQHQEEIHLVSCRQEFFEAKSGLHPLSKEKFDSNRVIDILYDYSQIQFHVSASFVKASEMKNHLFDEQMRYGEDALYVSQLILERHKYGVVSAPTHFYRKRANHTSALQGRETQPEWYFKTPERFYIRLMEASEKKWGTVIPYIQYLTCYDMQWRMQDSITKIMTEEEQADYLKIIKQLLLKCEDDVILMQKSINMRKKLFLLSLKYGEDVKERLFYLDGTLFWNNISLGNLKYKTEVKVEQLDKKEQQLLVSGQIHSPVLKDITFYIKDEQGKKYPIEKKDTRREKEFVWGKEIGERLAFDIALPQREEQQYRFEGTYKNVYPVELPGVAEETEETFEQTETKKKKEYLFTVIVKSNSPEKLAKTMDSLKRQTLPFQENIQVLIWTERKNIFPFIKQCAQNVGVCRRINRKKIRGQYIHYLKEGQVCPANLFEEAKKTCDLSDAPLSLLMAEENRRETAQNYVTAMINHARPFQENVEKYFFGRTLADYLDELIAAENKWEKLERLARILFEADEIGVIQNAEKESEKKKERKEKEDYLTGLPELRRKLEHVLQEKGEVWKNHTDILLLQQISKTLNADMESILTEEEQKQYEGWLKETLQTMDDCIIYKGETNNVIRIYLLSLKYGYDIREHLTFRRGKLLFHNIPVFDMNRRRCFEIESREKVGESWEITGKTEAPLQPEKIEFYLWDGRREFHFSEEKAEEQNCPLKYGAAQKRTLSCKIPVEQEKGELQLMCRYQQWYPVCLGKIGDC